MRSGWNTSRPSIFSATPTNLIGAPVTWRTDSAAPPRASPSSLVRMTPVSGSASRKALRGVDRVLALHRVDDEQRLDRLDRGVQLGDLAHHRLVDREPPGGVDDQHVVVVPPRPVERRRRRSRPAAGRRVDGKKSTPTCAGQRLQLLDRRRTVDVGADDQHLLLLLARAARASLAAVVVLPAPCRPASRITAGGCVARSSGAAAPPISAVSSRWTTPISAWPGVSEPTTSSPTALSRTRGDEVLDDRQRDVGLEQREAHLAQRVLDVGVGEARLAAQLS